MTVTTETPTTTTSEQKTDYMQWVEYVFYIALLAGVFFVAYQVMNGRWRLLERPAPESTAQENV